jgi:hypothetical protein
MLVVRARGGSSRLPITGSREETVKLFGDLLDTFEGAVERHLIGKHWAVAGDLILRHLVPDWQNTGLTLHFPCKEAVELFVGPLFPKEVLREDDDAKIENSRGPGRYFGAGYPRS